MTWSSLVAAVCSVVGRPPRIDYSPGPLPAGLRILAEDQIAENPPTSEHLGHLVALTAAVDHFREHLAVTERWGRNVGATVGRRRSVARVGQRWERGAGATPRCGNCRPVMRPSPPVLRGGPAQRTIRVDRHPQRLRQRGSVRAAGRSARTARRRSRCDVYLRREPACPGHGRPSTQHRRANVRHRRPEAESAGRSVRRDPRGPPDPNGAPSTDARRCTAASVTRTPPLHVMLRSGAVELSFTRRRILDRSQRVTAD